MKQLNLSGSNQLIVNVDEEKENILKLEVADSETSTVIITFEGNEDGEVSLEVKADPYSKVTILTINHCLGKLDFKENIELLAGSQVEVAHCELSDGDSNIQSAYNLQEEGASLHVLTASLTGTRKIFEQKTYHQKGNTTSNVDNYGVVLAKGNCEMVVENTITKGAHNSATHQTSRLLTNDKSARGKILPILNIYDNEVEASHAATLGQPNEDQLYYLCSRGLSRKQAMDLIVVGYLLPITQVIDNEEVNKVLKDEIEKKVSF